MAKKECPSCAMELDRDAEVCPICSYEFPSKGGSYYQWIAIVLVILFLLFFVIF